MLECPRCGKFYNADFDFCPYCGEKKPSPNVCPNCLKEYDDLEYSFCPKCGVELIKKTELLNREEEECIRKIEENRRTWVINQLKELDYDSKQLDELISKQIDKLESKIDRESEGETIKRNKELSLNPDEIDKNKFLRKLPSIENKLKAICLNPGSNPCIFIRDLRETEILEIMISDEELFLMDIWDIDEILYDFCDYCNECDINRGIYIEEEDDYEFYVEGEYSLDPITGTCTL